MIYINNHCAKDKLHITAYIRNAFSFSINLFIYFKVLYFKLSFSLALRISQNVIIKCYISSPNRVPACKYFSFLFSPPFLKQFHKRKEKGFVLRFNDLFF